MKKFISMVMAAAMVVSLVPATAFAASGTAVFKTAGVEEYKEGDIAEGDLITKSEIQIAVTDLNAKSTADDKFEITLDFDNLELKNTIGDDEWNGTAAPAKVVRGGVEGSAAVAKAVPGVKFYIDPVEEGDTSMTVTIVETSENILPGDVIILPFAGYGNVILTDDNEGTVATVTVSGDFGESEAMSLLEVVAEGLDVTVSGKPVEVAEEEIVTLKDITIKSKVGSFKSTDEVKVRITGGFEFVNVAENSAVLADGPDADSNNGAITAEDANGDPVATVKVLVNSLEEDEFIITGLNGVKKIFIDELVVEAVSADAGAVGEIVVSAKGYEGDSDEAVKVIADAVVMSVDEDDDVPVMYSGVNTDNWGLQTTNSHKALTVTIEETVADAWDTVKAWTLSLPEGVYVVNDPATVLKDEKVSTWKHTDMEGTFAKAYKDGDYEAFEFGRRSFEADPNEKVKLTLDLVLVAEPEFEGPVTLTLSGDGFEGEAEVVIAEFVKAYTVEAVANDLVIDYKETVVPTSVVIKEAEMGLWDDNTTTAKRAEFAFYMEDIEVEDGEVAVDEDSDMTIKDKTSFAKANLGFYVDEESDEQAAVVTLSDIALYMQRSIPAGAYDLDMRSSLFRFAREAAYGASDNLNVTVYDVAADADYVETVKEGFVNVITAGRDKDDASFTTKVVVPVGEAYLIAGEEQVALDVPAYINAAGYTMLPVRAVATALGIDTNNVLWSQAAKQVTILYGQRIITMTVGQSVIYVNGSAIPASAAVEVVDGRAFLGLRDLANALGVTDIAYDAATKTATLN